MTWRAAVTVEEIILKCKEMGVYLTLVNDKIKPVGPVSKPFLELSKTFVPYKEQLKEYLKKNAVNLDEYKVKTEAKIARLQINCIHLGGEAERPDNCNCAGKIIYSCAIYGKCKRAGNDKDIAVCTECTSYQPSN